MIDDIMMNLKFSAHKQQNKWNYTMQKNKPINEIGFVTYLFSVHLPGVPGNNIRRVEKVCKCTDK